MYNTNIQNITKKNRSSKYLPNLYHDSEKDYEGNGYKYHDYIYGNTLNSLFEKQVVKTPHNIALCFQDLQLTYKQLNSSANRLANFLINQSIINPDDLIVLCLDRTELTIISILAVLKTGAAYVPVDPGYPDERIKYMIEDTKPKLILTNNKYRERLSGICPESFDSVILPIDNDKLKAKIARQSPTNLPSNATATNLAYVIYTSGTTGKPKGVMVEHKGVINLVIAIINSYPLSVGKRIALYSNFVFDASVFEFFPAILSGSQIYLLSDELRFDLDLLISYYKQNKIQMSFMPSALMTNFIDKYDGEYLETIRTGGENLNISNNSRLEEISYKVLNCYGLTEVSVCSTQHRIMTKQMQKNIIGKPILNTKCYILDENLNLSPINKIGELYISGVGLARGYLNLPEQTQKVFLPNPYQTDIEQKYGCHKALYKTGDLARWLPDGNIEFIGRNDSQIKIMGHRIETGEIQNVLNNYPQIMNSVVTAKDYPNDSAHRYLIAYYLSECKLDEDDIYKYLANRLPHFMLPRTLIHVDKLPLNFNGKVDIKALPESEIDSVELAHITPQNELEEKIYKIFADLLELEKETINISDDFFKLGGTSIAAIKLMNQLYKELSVTIDIQSIMQCRNIQQLMTKITSTQISQTAQPKIKPYKHNNNKLYKLSFAQERMWFNHKLITENREVYNVVFAYKLNKTCNIELLIDSLKEVVNRHEILKTIIGYDKKGNTYQLVTTNQLQIIDKKALAKDELDKIMAYDADYLFKLDEELPIRVYHYKYENENYLSIVAHHIAFDGWSRDIFLRDTCAYYKSKINRDSGLNIPQLEIQYKDYALWQRDYLSGKFLQEQLSYWQNKLCNYQTLNLAIDKPRPQIFNYQGKSIECNLSLALSLKLRDLAKQNNVSLFSVLLSGFYIMLSAYSNQNDIILGTVASNRHHPQLENLIGFFVNTLILRQTIKANDNIFNFIKSVHKEVLEAQKYQDLPFDLLVKKLNNNDTSRHPIVQVMFTVQHFGEYHTHFMQEYSIQYNQTSKFDLTMIIDDGKPQLSCLLEYATNIYNQNTIQDYFNTYKFVLEQISEFIINKNNTKEIRDIKYANFATYQKLIKSHKTHGYKNHNYIFENTIHGLFEKQVKKTPHSIALCHRDHQLTYNGLNESANRLAHYLINQCIIQPDDLIILCLDRTELIIIAILAVLKIGAAYVPIDPSYPDDRIKYIISDTKPKLLLTNDKYEQKLSQVNYELDKRKILAIDNDTIKSQIAVQSSQNLKRHATATNLAYVIYTSGTSGNPKGVMIEHKGIINLAQAIKDSCQLSADKRVALYSNFVFDASVFEFFPAILSGSRVYLLSDELRLDIDLLVDYYEQNKITSSFIPSALLSSFIDKYDGNYLETLFPAGENFNLNSNINLLKLKYCVVNSYGVTEATVCSTQYKIMIEQMHNNVIGAPILNTRCYVLDKNLNLLPANAVGELYLSGVSIARGYINLPELNKKAFIPNPFQTDIERKFGYYSTLYKTGDLVRILPDGNLEFMGRDDFQIKILGHRIECREIEQVINSYPGIKQSTVIAHSQKHTNNNLTADKSLVAYYVKDVSLNITDQNNYIAAWEGLYNSNYQSLDIKTYKENIMGWKSSYTGQDIPKHEMLEWRDNILSRIRQLQPHKVLEVGSGSGLLMFNLIDLCEYYYATDFSDEAVNYLNKIIETQGYTNKSQVIECCADKIPVAVLEDKYDTVIINSVVQYFPNVEYLKTCLQKLIENITDTGQIFIGDIRNYRHIGCFYHSVLKHKGDEINISKIEYLVQREKELLISPEFFLELQNVFTFIYLVEVLPKLDSALNEMSKYRYDVILHINKTTQTSSYKVLESSNFISVLDVKQYLKNSLKEDNIYLSYPNKKAALDYYEYTQLYKQTCTVNPVEIDQLLSLNELENLFNLADYQVNFYLDISNPLNILIVGYKTMDNMKQQFQIKYQDTLLCNRNKYANNPILNLKKLEEDDNQSIKEFLQTRLPAYMIPNHFVMLDKLPLNINGKVEYQLLPEPQLDLVKSYTPPHNNVESKLCEMFAHTLGVAIEKISIDSDFSNLGGNSILAVKLLNQINTYFKVSLKVVDILIHQNVTKLAKIITKAKESFSLITRLNKKGKKPELFMIHPACSGTEVYTSLAKELSKQYNCYGIDNYNLHHQDKIYNLSALASFYLNAIDSCREETGHLDKPYYLFGWSLGGIIGLEIAAILEQRGVRDIHLMLIDPIVTDEMLIKYFNLENKQEETQMLEQTLLTQGHLEQYVNKVIANLACENLMCKQEISSHLHHTKILLFKATELDSKLRHICNEAYDYAIKLKYNNLDHITSPSNIQLVLVRDSNHKTILNQDNLIISHIKSWQKQYREMHNINLHPQVRNMNNSYLQKNRIIH